MFKKLKFHIFSKRIGPDLPLSHWMLHSRRLSKWLCKSKFGHFGENAQIRPNVTCVSTDKISIGDNVVLRPFTMLFAEGKGDTLIEIQNNVLIGSSVHVYVSNHEFNDVSVPIFFQGHGDSKKVTIQEGAWVGANVTILPGVVIGKNSVVGAGSVVTKSISPNVVVAGNPAKIIKKIQ